MNRRRSSRIILAMALVALLALAATATAVAAQGGAAKAPVTVQVSGTVTGHGGSGRWAWSMPLAQAQIVCTQLGASTSSDAAGKYALALTVPTGSYYDGISLRCSHRFYRPQVALLSAQNPQVKNFSLRVMATKVKFTVRSRGRLVRNARVYVFGYSRLTNRHGVVVFSGLGLKPLTKYHFAIEKNNYVTRTSSFSSRPGGERKISVSIRHM